MNTVPPPQPTLWRTCRALANHSRLQLFGLLLREPGLSVAAVAVRLKMPISVASEYLRALEARGLLTVKRKGRRVTYRPGVEKGEGAGPRLVTALRLAFCQERQMEETVFKLATAFTHPRRIAVFRALQSHPRTLGQLQMATGIPTRSLVRHLMKLEARGFVMCREGIYAATERPDALGRELARLAAESGT
jgi:DNA-binding transcriptional ArsR family regulator